MAKAIFTVFLNLIKTITNIFLLPVNTLVVQFFPDVSSLISTFNNTLENVLGDGLSFFSNILPPTCRTLIVIYLGVLTGYYTITISVHVILKVIHIIKAIKLW